MNDYRELCETLRLANSWQFAPKFVNAMLHAADAIEQLVRERDAAVADITELLRQPEVVTRCWACAKWEADGKFVNCSQTSNDCTAECSEAEWRGVRE